MELYKYHGAGNDFLVADNRDGRILHGEAAENAESINDSVLTAERIAELCDRRYGIGADGMMLLESADSSRYGKTVDFKMVYYNSDGSGGMMCGNGGRCIVAFAADCGISHFDFVAADGMHSAEIISSVGNRKIVKLKMKDVTSVKFYGDTLAKTGSPRLQGGYFLDTGTRHFVKPVACLKDYDVFGEGRKIRHMEEFSPVGTNVNFIEPRGNVLFVRTYEKGVEDETYACGTGITASAVAVWHHLRQHGKGSDRFQKVAETLPDGHIHMDVRALRDDLAVDFIPAICGAEDVWLTGPAVYVGKMIPYVLPDDKFVIS